MAPKPAGQLHVIVDGSNIATEGRSIPSLTQLNDAVMAFLDEHPDALVTVVVDATFGHRIHSSEVTEFDKAVANNELVAPPAGAVGRGDAFVLGIANKAGAIILSNDSFQEFHGQYPWLFDPGRLIGGKPVPHVGWVFVERTPVRGPVSRKAVRQNKNGDRTLPTTGRGRRVSKAAAAPMPVPTAPPPGARVAAKADRSGDGRKAPAAAPSPVAAAAVAAAAAEPKAGSFVNDLLPFLSFVEQHPVGSSVNAVVDSYSSHGAYVAVGDVRGYVPLRLMAEPPPRSAREVMKVGDAVTLVVHTFAPARRSIDLAVPHAAAAVPPVVEPVVAAPTRKRAAKAAPGPAPAAAAEKAAEEAAAPTKAAKKSAARPAAAVKRAAAKKAAVAVPDVGKPAVGKPDVGKPDVGKPAVGKPDVGKLDVGKPAVGKPAVGKPDVGKPDVGKPDVGKPDVGKPAARAAKAAPSDKPAKQAAVKKAAAKKAAARPPAPAKRAVKAAKAAAAEPSSTGAGKAAAKKASAAARKAAGKAAKDSGS
jgi:hypothetical protein